MEMYDVYELLAAVRNTDFVESENWNEPAPESELCFE